MAAACGGSHAPEPTHQVRSTTPDTGAGCLNEVGFLVESDSRRTIRGSSPDGVNFTVRFYPTLAAAEAARDHLELAYSAVIATTVVDFSGNPRARGGAPPIVL